MRRAITAAAAAALIAWCMAGAAVLAGISRFMEDDDADGGDL